MTFPMDLPVPDAPRMASGPRLRVMEAHLEDVERGVVRISVLNMHRMGLEPGDAVVIEGERQTLARVEPLDALDGPGSIIRMDGLTRENAGVTLDERVHIAAHAVPPAGTLLLNPLERTTFGPDEVRRVREWLVGRALVKGDKLTAPLFSRKSSQFIVAGFEPEGMGVISVAYTDVRIQDQGRPGVQKTYNVKYEDIGGLDEELRRIREMIELPMKYPQLFAQLRIEPPKGVLLYGPPGTG